MNYKGPREPVITLTRKDFDIAFVCGSGNGGQNKNRRHTAVRIRHKETGVEAYCCDERSQHQNLEKAFLTIAKRLMPWITREHNWKVWGRALAKEAVEEMMRREQDFRTEVKDDNGNWVPMVEGEV